MGLKPFPLVLAGEGEKKMADIIVPEISRAYKDKPFGPSDIKWVKTVNDENTSSAYLPEGNPRDKRLRNSSGVLLSTNEMVKNSDGVFFCLQLNPRFMDSLNQVPFGDLILLYQNLNKQNVKCFTHLVTPVGDGVIPNPYLSDKDGWPGRWVKVIAITKNKDVSSIRFDSKSTGWKDMPFCAVHSNLSHRDGRVRGIDQYNELSNQQVSMLQTKIWDAFQYFRR
jgi:hypothetical protein